MNIKVSKNENVLVYQYDESVEGVIPEMPDASEVTNKLLAGLPTSGVSTDPTQIDFELFLNLGSFSEVRVFDDFNNSYAIGCHATEECTKNIAFLIGMQATIIAFTKNSEGEYQRIRREITEYYESTCSSK